MSKEPLSQQSKKQDAKSDEAKKPHNLPANAMPTDGFVLSVDAKFKTRFESSEDAMAAAVKLKQSYPVVQVAIYDAAARVYTPIDLPEQDA